MILAPDQDAQGREMYDYYKGNRDVFEIIERDDGFVEAYAGPRDYLSQSKDWSSHQKAAIQYAHGRVLDIGCGAGRHSLYLQKKGQDVLGVDVSPLAIRVSRLRGLRKTRLMSINQLNSSIGWFDTILMLGNNFGLFGNPSQARTLLRRFLDLSNPKAKIIAESLDVYRPPVPSYHKRYHLRNKRRGRMAGQVRIRVRYHEFATPWFDYLLVSRNEMKRLVKGTGWTISRFIESKGPQYVAIIERE